MALTAAEAKTLRESFGLSAKWLADRSAISTRSIWHYEAGDMTVPERVARTLLEVDTFVKKKVAELLAKINAAPRHSSDQGRRIITLVRHRSDDDLWNDDIEMRVHHMPVCIQGIVISRVRDQLLSQGEDVVICYKQPFDDSRPVTFVPWN